ncbi:MAG: L-serine ammonia-lyase, iron-sulfur-dependent, subunit alpha [Flexilinea sp.]
MDCKKYENYIALLNKELKPALGCTEPIAIAYAVAKAREVLGVMPEHIDLRCSSNIIKNVKSVTVPNSGGLKGFEVAAVLGAVGGRPDRELEVLEDITEEDRIQARDYLAQEICTCSLMETPEMLHIIVEASAGSRHVLVEIKGKHTAICRIEVDDEVLYNRTEEEAATGMNNSLTLDLHSILSFACEVEIDDVHEVIERQIIYNTAISDEGLRHAYGAEIGRTILESENGHDIRTRAKARAAAGSDARMSGCALPVVINSGSGNQGMTVSLPVIEYSKELKSTHDSLIRALVLANLVSLEQKNCIGALSAFCGVVCAATGAASGIMFLMGGGYDEIAMVINNTLGNISGMVCDGTKPSCAAKIVSALEASLLAVAMTNKGRFFKSGDGLIKENADETIHSIGRMARVGMRSTDDEILHIMLEDENELQKGVIYSISLSPERGQLKKEVPKADVVPNYGIKNDGHAGDWERQITCLNWNSVKNVNKKYNMNIGPGDFAENILIDGLDFSSLAVGSRLKLGNDVLLEITQIGKEDHPSIVSKTFGVSLLPREGIFCKVLTGGIINKGDVVEISRSNYSYMI